jgi:hypothetical protein
MVLMDDFISVIRITVKLNMDGMLYLVNYYGFKNSFCSLAIFEF